MNNPTQFRSCIFGIPRRVAGAALALAIMLVPAVVATKSAQAQTYTYSVLYSFQGPPNDGLSPWARLLLDAPSGNLYGTTNEGGNCGRPGGCGTGWGTVFKLTPPYVTPGSETVLWNFTGGADGGSPFGDLVQDNAGKLYGTTLSGAAALGSAFEIDPNTNTLVWTYPFIGWPVDGANPTGGLVLDAAAGYLYGTTTQGGTSGGCCGVGTVFRLGTNGAGEKVLYSFGSTAVDGVTPYAGLWRGPFGNLYGTTTGGGANGYGTAFKLNPTSGKETVLWNFTGGADGGFPYAGLVRRPGGPLYGTTVAGGNLSCNPPYGCGTVFKLKPNGSGGWSEIPIYTFQGAPSADGAGPWAGLVRDAAGNLYGTTANGGDPSCNYGLGCGTVFKLAPPATQGGLWTETVLHIFKGQPDGGFPFAGLILDTQGNLYGATITGGTATGGECALGRGCGTVFKLKPAAATTTALSSSPNPSNHGQAVTFTAVVSSNAGAPPDGETVTFKKGTTVLGTGTLTGGSASFTTSTLPVGTSHITAVYLGDANFAGSKSNTVSQVVNKATTTTTLTSSLNPSNLGQPVTFTASVTPQFSGTVTGTVTFYDGTTALKTVILSGGVAKFTTSTLTSGAHNITATYNGSTSFIGSSASLTQTVN